MPSLVNIWRICELLIIAGLLVRAQYTYVDLEKKNHKLITKVVDECVTNTPVWFRKYRIEQEDQYLQRF